MKTIVIEANENIYHDIISFLDSYPDKELKFYNDLHDDALSEENKIAHQKAVKELESKQTISLEDLKAGNA